MYEADKMVVPFVYALYLLYLLQGNWGKKTILLRKEA